MTKAQDVAAGILIAIALFVWGVGFGVKTIETMPLNAPMYFDFETERYASPPCITSGYTSQYYGEVTKKGQQYVISPAISVDEITSAEAHKKGKPDEKCRDKGGFSGEQTSLAMQIYYQLTGKKPPSRWTKDGDWLW